MNVNIKIHQTVNLFMNADILNTSKHSGKTRVGNSAIGSHEARTKGASDELCSMALFALLVFDSERVQSGIVSRGEDPPIADGDGSQVGKRRHGFPA